MMDSESSNHSNEPKRQIWFLVEHESALPIYLEYAEEVEKEGFRVRVVNAPEVFGVLTKDAIVGNAEKIVHSIKTAIGVTSEEFKAEVRNASPGLLFVCGNTFLRPLTILSQLGPSPTAIVPILLHPDPSPSAFGSAQVTEKIQGWIVPTLQTKERFERLGYHRDRIVVGGFPFKRVGIGKEERDALRAKFGFGEEKIVIVRCGGIRDSSQLESLMFQLSLVSEECRLIFHHDGNRRLAEVVKQLAEKKGMSAQMFGRVDDLFDYVAAADLLLTVGSDDEALTAIAARTPLMFFSGVSMSQAEFWSGSVLVSSGAAELVSSESQIPKSILNRLREKATSTAETELMPEDTSAQLLKAIKEVIGKAESWKEVDDKNHSYPERPDYDPNSVPEGHDMTHGEEGSFFQTIGKREMMNGDDEMSTLDEMRRRFAAGDETPLADGPERGSASELKMSEDYFRVPLNKEEAKALMTQLILDQKRLEAELEDAQENHEKWYRRLNLARSQAGNEDLEESARVELQKAGRRCDDIRGQLNLIENRKAAIKRSLNLGSQGKVSGQVDGPSDDLEDRFRQLEDDARLDDFKRGMEE